MVTESTSYSLRAVREHLGITHAEMARRLHLHIGTYANYELGHRTPRDGATRERINAFVANVRAGGRGVRVMKKPPDTRRAFRCPSCSGLRFMVRDEATFDRQFTLWWQNTEARYREPIAKGAEYVSGKTVAVVVVVWLRPSDVTPRGPLPFVETFASRQDLAVRLLGSRVEWKWRE